MNSKLRSDLTEFFGVDLVSDILSEPEDKKPEWASDEAQVLSAVSNFQQLFTLMAKHPSAQVVPDKSQDYVWHRLMLRPVAYYNVCMAKAGHVIDHQAGFGRKNAEEAIKLRQMFTSTQELWEREFGTKSTAMAPEPSTCFDCTNK